MKLSRGFSGEPRFVLYRASFPLLNSLSLADGERDAFVPNVLEMGSCNSPASWFYILQRNLRFLWQPGIQTEQTQLC